MAVKVDQLKNVELKNVILKANEFKEILCNLKTWCSSEESIMKGQWRESLNEYNNDAHDTLCSGLRNFTRFENVKANIRHADKNKVAKLTTCLRHLSSKMPKEYVKVEAVKRYTVIANQLSGALDGMKREPHVMAVFFAKPGSAQPTPPGKRPVLSAHKKTPLSNDIHSRPSSSKVRGTGECPSCTKLKKEVEIKKSSITQLYKEIDMCKGEMRSIEDVNAKLRSENTILQECLDNLKKPKEQKELMASFSTDKLLQTKERYIEDIKEGFEKEIEYKDRMIQHMRDEIASLTDRLSAEMGKKVSSDESSIENISIKNRPMVVAEDYYNFCSNAWLDAKTVLDEKCAEQTEDKALQFLNSVLQVAYKTTHTAFQKVFKQLDHQISQPGHVLPSEHGEGKLDRLPPEVQLVVGDYMRVNSDKTDVTTLSMDVKEKLRSVKSYSGFIKVLKDESVSAYINEAALICWKMAIQRPPMEFRWDGIGKAWQELLQEPYWSCDPYKDGATVQYYIHPSLHHGGAALVKGKIFIQ